MQKKALIIDSSGIRPFLYAEENLGLDSVTLSDFMDYVGVDLFESDRAVHELSFAYNSQPGIFTTPLSAGILLNAPQNFSISLSSSGHFSATADSYNNQFTVGISKSTPTGQQGVLWESSPHWNYLSLEDKSLVTLGYQLAETYDQVVVLTNDWHLRQQCLRFEGISTYGSASMLAGMVLTDFITIQRGTYIYGGWSKQEPHWIPYKKIQYGAKKKLTFAEVLFIERERISKNRSFWSS